MATSLTVGDLLSRSLQKRQGEQPLNESNIYTKQDSDLNIDLGSAYSKENDLNINLGSAYSKENDLNINLEAIAAKQKQEEKGQELMEQLGEDTVRSLRAVVGAGIAVNGVLEARAKARAQQARS